MMENNEKEVPSSATGPESENDSSSDKRSGARGTAAMDARTRQHMAEIGRKGGQAVSKNREHMAKIGRKGGAASRGTGKTPGENEGENEGNSGNA
jgi:general stress protein YciG